MLNNSLEDGVVAYDFLDVSCSNKIKLLDGVLTAWNKLLSNLLRKKTKKWS